MRGRYGEAWSNAAQTAGQIVDPKWANRCATGMTRSNAVQTTGQSVDPVRQSGEKLKDNTNYIYHFII